MAKLKLEANPTFDASVDVPVPGSDPVPVRFTFKHRTRSQYLAWVEEAKDRSDAEVLMELAIGWEFDDEFNAENAAKLCDNYAGVGVALVQTYHLELLGQRTKNS